MTTTKKPHPAPRSSRKTSNRPPVPRGVYRIPELWNCWDFPGRQWPDGRTIAVHPLEYTADCLLWIIANRTAKHLAGGESLSRRRGIRPARGQLVRDGAATRRPGDWIRDQVMYGMMIRTSTAWDHDGDGRLASRRFSEQGTFLKTVLLLPHLHRMGVSVLYLLPVVKVSTLYRKGELGCPYSAKNFYELDPGQHDALYSGDPDDVNAEFLMFVECAHQLGMRVMIDVAPRTAARDCDWILDHPEWFYWIDRRFARSYCSPPIPGVTYSNPIAGRLEEIYDQPAVRAHLARFRFAPNVTDPQKWANFAKRAKARPPADLVAEIAKHFGVITPPGFSDCINDPQPPWSDVTYLRLFHDHPTAALPHLPKPAEQPPYVLFDTAKASLFEGRRPNQALWKKLAGIIPFYQQFGIDGARVDMAHALPHRLERMILDEARRRDPDFCFLAEELGTSNHAKARAAGYNIIIGPSWWMQPRGHEGQMHKLLAGLPKLKVPIMAAAETPDTPRAVVRRGGRQFSRQAVVVNCFLPNAVPMINSGMEVYERQPMNLGLDNVAPGRDALPKSDPLAGKLAFFDRYALHWDNPGGQEMVDLIAQATALRRRFAAALTDPRAYFAPTLSAHRKSILATGFRLGRGQGLLLMLANLDYRRTLRATVSDLPANPRNGEVLLDLVPVASPALRSGRLTVTLAPAGATVLLMGP